MRPAAAGNRTGAVTRTTVSRPLIHEGSADRCIPATAMACLCHPRSRACQPHRWKRSSLHMHLANINEQDSTWVYSSAAHGCWHRWQPQAWCAMMLRGVRVCTAPILTRPQTSLTSKVSNPLYHMVNAINRIHALLALNHHGLRSRPTDTQTSGAINRHVMAVVS